MRTLASSVLLALILLVTPASGDAYRLENKTLSAEEEIKCSYAFESLQKWHKKLMMSNWKIQFVCSVPDDAPENIDHLYGKVAYDLVEMKAVLFMNPRPQADPEEIVLHELLHIVLAEIKGSDSGLSEERAARTISRCLIEK